MTTLPADARPVVSKRALFLCFLLMGLSSFGGVLPFARRTLVEQRGWLSNAEFIEMLSLGQVLPGPNVMNLSIMVGRRFQGSVGAVLSVSGLLLAPLVIILGLATLYQQVGQNEGVQRAIAGTASASAGLVVAAGISMLLKQPRRWRVMSMTLLAFLGSGLLGLPLLLVLAVLIPLGIALAWSAPR